MSSIKSRVEAGSSVSEIRLGIDREGRTVWMWLLPPGMGPAAALKVLPMPGQSALFAARAAASRSHLARANVCSA
jgi:hypothetical protein